MITFEEQVPKNNTWINVVYNGNPKYSEKLFFIEMKRGVATLSEDEELQYVFTAGEEGITHWYE